MMTAQFTFSIIIKLLSLIITTIYFYLLQLFKFQMIQNHLNRIYLFNCLALVSWFLIISGNSNLFENVHNYIIYFIIY